MVKALNNPQGARVLVNELVGALCLDYLGVKHPRAAVVEVPQEVIDINPEAKFRSGTPLCAGLAFGSELWQSDPGGTVASELLSNRQDMAGTKAVDTWIGQNDSPTARQYRIRSSAVEPGKYDYFPVDQGYNIGSPGWDAATLDGKHDQIVVQNMPLSLSLEEFKSALDRLREFDEAGAEHIVSQIPEEWLSGGNERKSLVRYLAARAAKAAAELEKA
jgi:hypothetical protein